jgi:molybdate transport system permease protein
MPPLVTSLALLVLLGGSSPLGRFLSRHGVDVLFSKTGIVLAQLLVSIRFVWKSMPAGWC